MKNQFYISLIALLLGASNANAAPANHYDDDEFSSYEEANDPIEPVNRGIHEFNQVIDGIVYKPITRIYRGVVPVWGRDRVSNVVDNIGEPVTVVNSVLQGDAQNAFTSFWRFIINTTFGVLGTFDAATEVGLKERKEDFGQTLAVWGWKDSGYFVIPFIGPSTFRDTLGMGVDFFIDPFTNANVVTEQGKWAIVGVRALDLRSRLLPVTDDIEKNSFDTYASYRSLYLQKRKDDINNSKLPPVY